MRSSVTHEESRPVEQIPDEPDRRAGRSSLVVDLQETSTSRQVGEEARDPDPQATLRKLVCDGKEAIVMARKRKRESDETEQAAIVMANETRRKGEITPTNQDGRVCDVEEKVADEPDEELCWDEVEPTIEHGENNIITLHADEQAPWDSPEEGEIQEVPGVSKQKLVRLVRDEGLDLSPPPSWTKRRAHRSLHILHDGLLIQWPEDPKCFLTHERFTLKDWIRRLRSGTLRLKGHSVVLCLREFQGYDPNSTDQE